MALLTNLSLFNVALGSLVILLVIYVIADKAKVPVELPWLVTQ